MCLAFFRKVIYLMKLLNLTNIEGFFNVVEACKGAVYITSPQGDRLNLKSSLTKYIILTDLFSNARINELELETEYKEDAVKFYDFMVRGD